MPFYKKKPVIVEARQYTLEDRDEIAKWCGAKTTAIDEDGSPYELMNIIIPTLEGDMRSCLGDYIVKGSQFGEFWSVKKEIFEATYEAVAPEGIGIIQ